MKKIKLETQRLDLQYTFGLTMNATLKDRSEPLLKHLQTQYEQTGQPQRSFCDFWYLSPAPGEPVDLANDPFRWTEVPGATSYRVRFARLRVSQRSA